jgi:hypothetical protein
MPSPRSLPAAAEAGSVRAAPGGGSGATVGWPAVVVALATAAAFANALGAAYQFDDFAVIVGDPAVRDLAAWWQAMPGIRPLLKLGYALNHASGLGAAGFHAVNVGVHAANALLVLWLVRRFLTQLGQAPATAGSRALATALLFALHPVQTEAVTYASGRSTAQATLFALATLCTWAAGRARGRALLVHVASPLCLALAIASKETAVVAPALLWLWAAADPTRPFRAGEILRATAVHGVVLLAAAAALLALPAYRALLATSLATRTPPENLLAQVHGLGWLAGQVVRIDRLNADPALPVLVDATVPGVAALAALAATTLAALAWLRRQPLPAFAWLWCVLWLAPTNSLLARLDVANDRQLYAALVAPALLVVAFACRLTGGRDAIAGALLVPLLVVLGAATHARNEVYRDEVAFWQDVIAGAPHNARAFNNLGVAHAARCDLDAARTAWQRALATDTASTRAAANLRLLDAGLLPAGIGPCPRPAP